MNPVTMVRWLNGRASDYESGGSRFDPWVDRIFALFFLTVPFSTFPSLPLLHPLPLFLFKTSSFVFLCYFVLWKFHC